MLYKGKGLEKGNSVHSMTLLALIPLCGMEYKRLIVKTEIQNAIFIKNT
jgi:hypothetical protein